MNKIYGISFSPTGGTERVAAILATALADETVLVDLTARDVDFGSVTFGKDDVAMIAVPSYSGRVPPLRRRVWPRCTVTAHVLFWSVSMATGPMRIHWWSCVIRPHGPDLLSLQPWQPWPSIRLPANTLRDVPMRMTKRCCAILQRGFAVRSIMEILANRRFRAIVPIARLLAPVSCPKLHARASSAAFVRRNVPSAPSMRRIRVVSTRSCVSPACGALRYVHTERGTLIG